MHNVKWILLLYVIDTNTVTNIVRSAFPDRVVPSTEKRVLMAVGLFCGALYSCH